MKMLSRKEIDKLLERDKIGRPAKRDEILLLQSAINNRKYELGMKKDEKLPEVEMKRIITALDLDDVEFMLL